MNPEITLSLKDSSHLISIIKEKFLNLYRILHEVDPKEADKFQSLNHYYFEKSHQHNDHCNQSNNQNEHKHSHGHQCGHDEVTKNFFIPEKEQTFVQQILYEACKDYNFREILPNILEDLSKKFNNIKAGGLRDKLEWNQETEKFVLAKVLTEGITKSLATYVKKQIQRDQHVDSKQPLLLATPQSWYEKFPKIKLDFLKPDIIGALLDKGYSVQTNFIEETNFPITLAHEVKYFYHEGRFESPSYTEEQTRDDKILSFQFTDIDPKSSKNFNHICKVLTGLPFELNLKANIYAQVSESFQLSYFSKDNGFQKIHYDSSFQEKYDNGKKISALYVFSSEEMKEVKPKLTIHKKDSTEVLEEIEISLGSLILIKSRIFPYSLSIVPQGTFILRYWINGPADKAQLTM